MLVDFERACKHLRVDGLDDPEDIQQKLVAAEIRVQMFLDRRVYESQALLDAAVTAGTAGVKPMVCDDLIRTSILLTLTDLYVNRGSGSGAGMPTAAADYVRGYRLQGA